MTLTYEDRRRWMHRLEERLDSACQYLCRQEKSLGQMKREAKLAAAEGLGIRRLLDERDKVLNDGEQLRLKEKRLRREMHCIVSGEEPADVTISDHPSLSVAVTDALDREARKKLRAMLKKSAIGRTVLGLKRDRRELEDIVMLVRSDAELQRLWASILERIGQSSPAGIDDAWKRDVPTTPEG